jgi:hypothetical protein
LRYEWLDQRAGTRRGHQSLRTAGGHRCVSAPLRSRSDPTVARRSRVEVSSSYRGLDFSALLGGFASEYAASRLSFQLYISSAFSAFEWSNFYPPTLKTAVFGFAIGTISSFLGYTTDEGADGVGRAATRGVVVSSLVIIFLDVLLIKLIFFIFPETAL